MPPTCPICEQSMAPSSQHCGVCGFPTALAIEGLRSVSSEPVEAASLPVEQPALRTAAAPSPPAPEAELTATIGRALVARSERLRPLGRDLPNVTSDLCEAALSEAAGHVAQALEILRGAQARFEDQAQEALRRRTRSVEDRQRALQRTGLKLALSGLPPTGEGADGRDSEALLDELVAADRRLSRIESDWKGLQGLLSQIEALRSEAAELGIPLDTVSVQLAAIRDQLSGSSLTPEVLDGLAEEAAQTLLALHESVPTSLEEELARHAVTIQGSLPDRPSGRAARKLHEEATLHLKRGRLNEAVQSVKDLRRAIQSLEVAVPPPAPRAPAAAPPAPPPLAPPREEVTLDVLLKKARSLAARVRTLPAESEMAREAAAQIREATDLLRAQKLEEANRTLTELMRSLAAQEGG